MSTTVKPSKLKRLLQTICASVMVGNDLYSQLFTSVAGVDGDGTDQAGSDITLDGGKGTGTAAGGKVKIRGALAGAASGKTLGTLVDRVIVNNARKTLTDAAVNLFDVALPAGAMAGFNVLFAIRGSDGVDVQCRSGIVSIAVVNKAGAYTITATVSDALAATGASTLTIAFGKVDGVNKVTITLTPTGSLVETTYDVEYTVINNSNQAITIL